MAIPKFSNEPVLDFTTPANKKKQLDALKKIKAGLGQEFPILIGSEHIRLDEKFSSFNPSRPTEVIGVFQKGSTALANKAMDVALAAFEQWKTVAPAKRAAVLFKAAAIMKKKRFELNAIMILEVGKTWPEADADTAEAIDFLEFYGREMLRYGEEHPVVKNPGE
ncbi:partial 1-pyrroline-5-carboxylate dehydrogenase, partial [uncultured bacterium]